MADDRYEDRYRGDRYGERGYGREDRGFVDRARDEVRSWVGDDEAARRRRMDELARRERARGRDYGPGYEGEWGDYPYRGERWSGSEAGGMGGRPYERADYFSREQGPEQGPGETALWHGGYPRRYDRPYSWESWRHRDFRGRGPKGYQRSDIRINEDVCDMLADAPDVDASDIEVKTTNGEVMLSGTVSDRDQKRRAEDLIERVSGVREVHNNLRVTPWQEATTTAATPAGARR